MDFMFTEEQKRKYLPQIASGEKLAAFALSEPEAGILTIFAKTDPSVSMKAHRRSRK